MCITKEHMFKLVDYLKNVKLLMCLHLSDNGIARDEEYMMEILEKFGMENTDLPFIRQTNSQAETGI